MNKHLGPYETSVDIPAGLDIQNLAGGFDHKIKVHNPKYPYRENCIVIVLTTGCAATINLLEKKTSLTGNKYLSWHYIVF